MSRVGFRVGHRSMLLTVVLASVNIGSRYRVLYLETTGCQASLPHLIPCIAVSLTQKLSLNGVSRCNSHAGARIAAKIRNVLQTSGSFGRTNLSFRLGQSQLCEVSSIIFAGTGAPRSRKWLRHSEGADVVISLGTTSPVGGNDPHSHCAGRKCL